VRDRLIDGADKRPERITHRSPDRRSHDRDQGLGEAAPVALDGASDRVAEGIQQGIGDTASILVPGQNGLRKDLGDVPHQPGPVLGASLKLFEVAELTP
jgi:hypothetical protein